MPEPQTFDERALAVIKDHIRAVVLIDDRWPEEPIRGQPIEEIDPELIELAPDEVEIEPPQLGPRTESLAQYTLAEVDLMAVQRAALARGIVFSGIRFVPDDPDCETAARKLAMRADIIVLDWQLAGNDAGRHALELIKYLLDERRASGPRFIYVFTGSTDLHSIGAAIREELGDNRAITQSDFEVRNNIFSIRRKGDANSTQGETGDTVRHEDLIDDAIRSLARARSGLLELAWIELTTRHRWQLSSMIERMSTRYDVALLVEHVFGSTLNLTDRSNTVHELLFDEWRAQLAELEDTERSRILSRDGVDAYLKKLASRLPEMSPFSGDATPPRSDASKEEKERYGEQRRAYASNLRAELSGLLQGMSEIAQVELTGKDNKNLQDPNFPVKLRNWLSSLESFKEPPFSSGQTKGSVPQAPRHLAFGVTSSLADSGPQVHEVPSLAPFLQVQSLLTQRRHLPSRITQGTVLRLGQFESDGTPAPELLICITPLCDAARPKEISHTYMFVSASPMSRDDQLNLKAKQLDDAQVIVLDLQGEAACYEVKIAPILSLVVKSATIQWRNGVPESIHALRWPVGKPDDPVVTLYPIAQLRRDRAFHLCNAALRQAGRIGLNNIDFVR